MSTVEKWINKMDGSRGGTPGKRQILQDLLVEFLLLEPEPQEYEEQPKGSKIKPEGLNGN